MLMRWTRLAADAGAVISAGGIALASRGEIGEGKVKIMSERDVAETVNGKVARVTMVEGAFEPGGSLHRVSRNPSHKNRTRVQAVILHPRDPKQLTTPASTE
jgi:hypothetical protein